MQPTPPIAPAPPAPPAADVAADPYYGLLAREGPAAQGAAAQAVASARAVPRTAQEIAGLRRQREELSNQLVSAQGRRRDVARALERADNPANRAGLEQRLQVLDRRIAQLETDISETGQLLTNAPPALFGTAVAPSLRVLDRGPPPGAILIVFILFVLFPLALALSRGIWRRGRGVSTRPDPLQRESAERLARLEQAVDAIAVEVERVSEGQRFVTRLLAESREPQALPVARNGAHETLDVVGRPLG